MLNTLKNLKEVNGIEVRHITDGQAMEASENPSIIINHDRNMVSFKLMTKPAKEGGTGCQHVHMIGVAKHIIESFAREEEKNLTEMKEKIDKGSFTSMEESEKLREKHDSTLSSYSCNTATHIALAAALHRQDMRTSDRERRGVEGTYKS